MVDDGEREVSAEGVVACLLGERSVGVCVVGFKEEALSGSVAEGFGDECADLVGSPECCAFCRDFLMPPSCEEIQRCDLADGSSGQALV